MSATANVTTLEQAVRDRETFLNATARLRAACEFVLDHADVTSCDGACCCPAVRQAVSEVLAMTDPELF